MIFNRRRSVIINVAGLAVRKILWLPDQEKFFLLTPPFIEHSGMDTVGEFQIQQFQRLSIGATMQGYQMNRLQYKVRRIVSPL
jgi:hypothetical protein